MTLRGAPCWIQSFLVGVAFVGFVNTEAVAVQRGGPPQNPRAAAPVDLTGYWVSVITEDWRFRMVTPQKGDYESLPINDAARQLADVWDPAQSPADCKPYGAAAIMRMPTRLRITWEDENTLRLDTEAGAQSRMFNFDPAKVQGEGTWQGRSVAQWEGVGGAPGGNLKVITRDMRAGYLRKNGVPYSNEATVTEYFHRIEEANGDSLLLVFTYVEDPRYLNGPFITSTHFKKISDVTDWNPTPCGPN